MIYNTIGTSVAYDWWNMSQKVQLVWWSAYRWNGRDGQGQFLLWNGSYETKKGNMNIQSSLGFARLKDGDLGGFATGVHDGLVANATLFVEPEVTPAELLTGINAYASALGATTNRGKAQTIAKNNARAALVEMLRTLASYVNGIAKGDPMIIIKAGFVPTGMSANPETGDITLDKPVIVSIRNGVSGQLLVRVKGSAYAFEGQTSNGTGTWQTAGISTQARQIELNGLTPLTICNVRVRGIGPNNTYSDWSNPTSHPVV